MLIVLQLSAVSVAAVLCAGTWYLVVGRPAIVLFVVWWIQITVNLQDLNVPELVVFHICLNFVGS